MAANNFEGLVILKMSPIFHIRNGSLALVFPDTDILADDWPVAFNLSVSTVFVFVYFCYTVYLAGS